MDFSTASATDPSETRPRHELKTRCFLKSSVGMNHFQRRKSSPLKTWIYRIDLHEAPNRRRMVCFFAISAGRRPIDPWFRGIVIFSGESPAYFSGGRSAGLIGRVSPFENLRIPKCRFPRIGKALFNRCPGNRIGRLLIPARIWKKMSAIEEIRGSPWAISPVR